MIDVMLERKMIENDYEKEQEARDHWENAEYENVLDEYVREMLLHHWGTKGWREADEEGFTQYMDDVRDNIKDWYREDVMT